MRIYLAGPMRGIPEFNFPAFRDATAKLRALGHEVFSPAEKDQDAGFDPSDMKGDNAELGPVGFELSLALAMDLDYVCNHAEAVVVLPGWGDSLGAAAEIAAARALSKPVWPLENVLRPDEGTKADTVGFIDEFVPPASLPADWTFIPFTGRNFESGAYRDSEDGKLDFEGFLSPLVLTEFAAYMHSHRKQSDGRMRDSDNWQKGIPFDVYMKSMFRHFMDVWTGHRENWADDAMLEALMALLFNVQGYAHEILTLNEDPWNAEASNDALEGLRRKLSGERSIVGD